MKQINTRGGEKITLRNSNIELYFKEVNKYKILTAHEEYDMILNDTNWREKLVLHNLSFVVSVANNYNPKTPHDLEELIMAGNEGLILASKKFNPDRGFKFISYAVWWISQKILQYLAKDVKMISLPANIAALQLRINQLSNNIEDFQLLSDDIVLSMLQDLYPTTRDIDLDLICKLKHNEFFTSSLNAPIDVDGESIEFIELLKSEDNFSDDLLVNETLKGYIKNKLKTDKQYNIFIKHLGLFGNEPHSFKELGLQYNCTYESARGNYKNALYRLKRDHKLKEFLCENYSL
jgi:RNA polymerase primary sigma factor